MLIIGNLVGAIAFAWAIRNVPLFGEPGITEKMRVIAQRSTSDGFALTLLRGVMAGWSMHSSASSTEVRRSRMFVRVDVPL